MYIKLIILIILLLLIYIKQKKYLEIIKINKNYLYQEKKLFKKKFLVLKEKPSNKFDPIFIKEKEMFLNMISKKNARKVSDINTIIFSDKCKFGNCLIFISRLIFFCEFVECKRIILNKNIYWFLKKKIVYQKFNMTIEVDDMTEYYNNSSFLYVGKDIYYDFFYIRPESRINIIKEEILSNIPKVNIHQNDLYILII